MCCNICHFDFTNYGDFTDQKLTISACLFYKGKRRGFWERVDIEQTANPVGSHNPRFIKICNIKSQEWNDWVWKEK